MDSAGEEKDVAADKQEGEEEAGSEGSNELLDWDDDNFELEDVTTSRNATTGISVEESTKDPKEQQQQKEEEEEDWLMTSNSPTPTATEAAVAGSAPKTSSSDSYLTKQFRSLNTPVSMKKARCADCTRPLSMTMTAEVRKLPHLCDKCYYEQTRKREKN